VRVYLYGRKTFLYRHFVGKIATFLTPGEYLAMSISSALETFENLSSCSDVIKVTNTSGTLADRFEAHKTDFIASCKPAEESVAPTKFMNSDFLTDNIKRFCERKSIDLFIPRDYFRTFSNIGRTIENHKRNSSINSAS